MSYRADLNVQCVNGAWECLGPDGDPAWQCIDCALGDVPEPVNIGTDWLFVYGTLMAEQPNAPMLGMTDNPVAARVPGEMYWVSGSTGYPVVTSTTDPDTFVYGELYRVSLSDITGVILMEVGAGYELRWADVTRLDTGKTVQSIMFGWPWDEKGSRIPHGCWRARHHG